LPEIAHCFPRVSLLESGHQTAFHIIGRRLEYCVITLRQVSLKFDPLPTQPRAAGLRARGINAPGRAAKIARGPHCRSWTCRSR
jgi:hypothetical protein